MTKTRIIIAAVILILVGFGYRQGSRFPNKSHNDIAKKEDLLSAKYEYWTIEFSGTHVHERCKGKFKTESTLNILFPGSLVQILSQMPDGGPKKIEGSGIFFGTESVLQDSKLSKTLLVPSVIEGTPAAVTAVWSKVAAGTKLEIDVKAENSLINNTCSVDRNLISPPIRALHLNVTSSANTELRGSWTVEGKEKKYISPKDFQGTFRMIWAAGGMSGRPIPPPLNLRSMARDDFSVLLQWTPMPLAEKYDIYYSKGKAISETSAEVTHLIAREAFVAIQLHDDSDYTFAVSATIGDIQTLVSRTLTTALRPPTATK